MAVTRAVTCLPARWRSEERAELGALASLPAMTATTLRALLEVAGPRRCWAAVRAGELELFAGLPAARLGRIRALAPRWRAVAGRVEARALLAGWEAGGLGVLAAGDAAFPGGIARPPSGPLVLFARGGPGPPPRARVAVVGTRSSTAYGERVASALARGLASCGVDLVTSLEPGIDAAVRQGALLAGAGGALTAFAAGGPDADRSPGDAAGAVVAGGGCVVSDAPFGAAPERWRFPRRNRLVACSGDVVVLVEAHATGGVVHAAEAALELGVPVCAVPGSVRSASSRGTNALLADGAHVVRDVEDVLAVVELACAARFSRPPRQGVGARPAPLPGGIDGAILARVDEVVTPVELVLERSGCELAAAALSLERLVAAGLVEREPGGYRRPVTPGAGLAPDRLQP